MSRFLKWWGINQTVSALSKLDDQTLKDIGIGHRSQINARAHAAFEDE